MKKIILTVVAVMIVTAGASADVLDTSWAVTDVMPGTNVENWLTINEAVPGWTNSHVEINVTSGSIINIMELSGFPATLKPVAAFSTAEEDTGCNPGALVAYHTESETYVETDWGIQGGDPALASYDYAYEATLTPDAAGNWLLKSYNLNDGVIFTKSGPIENGVLVPEPATMTLIGLGGLVLLRRRR